MEFKNQYLTYEEYEDLEGTLDEVPFNLLEYEAQKIVDERTQARLKNIEDIPQEIKLCIFKMINSMKSYVDETFTEKNIAQNKNIKSERIDGYSVTYLTSAEFQELIKARNIELNDIIETMLYGVVVNNEHILYLGVD